MIPVNGWILKVCAGIALLCVVGLYGYGKGKDRVQDQWDASVARGMAEIERLKGEAGKVTVKVETEYVEVVKTIREKGDVVIREVPVYIPAAADSYLPNGFVWLHDDGVRNDPVSRSSESAYGAASDVAVSEAIGVIVPNYTTCHETAARLTALQRWVAEQYNLNPGE